MAATKLDPNLREALRAAHANVPRSPDGTTCICGLAGPTHPACAAVAEILSDRSRLRRTVEAIENYRMVLFDIAPETLERYVGARGWHCVDRDDEVSHWSCDDGVTEWTLTIGYRPGNARPVDHLRDALETLERVESRPRYAILAELLPEPDD